MPIESSPNGDTSAATDEEVLEDTTLDLRHVFSSDHFEAPIIGLFDKLVTKNSLYYVPVNDLRIKFVGLLPVAILSPVLALALFDAVDARKSKYKYGEPGSFIRSAKLTSAAIHIFKNEIAETCLSEVRLPLAHRILDNWQSVGGLLGKEFEFLLARMRATSRIGDQNVPVEVHWLVKGNLRDAAAHLPDWYKPTLRPAVSLTMSIAWDCHSSIAAPSAITHSLNQMPGFFQCVPLESQPFHSRRTREGPSLL